MASKSFGSPSSERESELDSMIARVVVCVLFLATSWFGSDARAQELDPVGRHCLVCDRELESADTCIVHRGRTVPLCTGMCADKFTADPELFFARSSPRGAFLQEDPVEAGPMRGPWFWFGVYVVAGLISAALSAYIAVNRAQPPLGWFFAGLFGNVAALVVVLFFVRRGDATLLPAGVPSGLNKVPTTRRPRACPSCGRHNHPSASSCASCGTALQADVVSEVATVKGSSSC